MAHPIHIGVGGWVFEEWDESFYPADLPKKKQLDYMSRALTAIEINGTFYRLQTPDTYRKWAEQTPENFKFTVKAHNYCMSRKTPEDIKTAIGNFMNSGVTELGSQLGAINWQFHPSKKFDPDLFKAFLGALPKTHNKLKLRHAIEVRDPSFNNPAFHDLLRKHNAALVSADDDDWPQADVETADFAYARLQRSQEKLKTGYAPKEIEAWAKTFQSWAKTREVFGYFIAGAKARNPAAAQALIAKLA